MAENSNNNGAAAQRPRNNPFCVNVFPADTTGCDFYRNFCPRETIEHMVGNIIFNTCRKFMVDDNFFKGANVNILQRQVNNSQCEYYLRYIIPMSRKCGSWIVYNIDDCIHMNDIPKYNKAWEVYQDKQYMQNIHDMMTASDFVLVTTDELGEYYCNRFEVNPDSIIVIPNYVPQWWMGHCYNLVDKMKQYDEHVNKKHKARIGLIGAPSHYDVNGKNIKNDISGIVDYIKKTTNEYQWVIFGARIPELMDLIKEGKVEYHDGIDILHYPDVICGLELQYIVAPLADNIFNRCKSNIKLTESWAMGIGCAAQNLPAYSKYTEDVFDGEEQLDVILKRDLADETAYSKKIASNYLKMNDWWLEGHLGDWLKLYRLRQKPLLYNYDMNVNVPANGGTTNQPSNEIEAPKIKIPVELNANGEVK